MSFFRQPNCCTSRGTSEAQAALTAAPTQVFSAPSWRVASSDSDSSPALGTRCLHGKKRITSVTSVMFTTDGRTLLIFLHPFRHFNDKPPKSMMFPHLYVCVEPSCATLLYLHTGASGTPRPVSMATVLYNVPWGIFKVVAEIVLKLLFSYFPFNFLLWWHDSFLLCN